MNLSLIAAVSDNGVIGKDGKLPWRIQCDLDHFRELTMEKPVIMGRRTFESLGKPLPGRDNLVVTSDSKTSAPNTFAFLSLGTALDHALACGFSEAFVIGGARLYAAALPFATRLYLTRVHTVLDGDAFFPHFNADHWMEESCHECDCGDGLRHSFIVYTRSSND